MTLVNVNKKLNFRNKPQTKLFTPQLLNSLETANDLSKTARAFDFGQEKLKV